MQKPYWSVNPIISIMKIIAPAVMVLGLWACSYVTPPIVTPPPNEELIDKSFFVNPDGTAKTFMCAHAPIAEVGWLAEWTQVHGASTIPVCNLQFVPQQNKLIGFQVNPSLPKEKWAAVVTFTIRDHVAYVPVKDKYQRDTNEWHYDSRKDYWKARPSIILDYDSVDFLKDPAYALLYGKGAEVLSTTDKEHSISNGRSFLGFTIAVSSTRWGRYNQAKFRINFLEIKTDKSFKPRAYDDNNSNHFGVLWGMGKKIEGLDLNPYKFVARWDMRPEKLPHEICLYGFEGPGVEDPELGQLAKKVAIEAIDQWNDTLIKVLKDGNVDLKGKKPFVISNRQMNFPFDLRCSTISFVSDRIISDYSPLGIAMVQADVTNGEILWGGAAIYGGSLKSYLEYFRGSGGSGATTTASVQFPRGTVFTEDGEAVYGVNPFDGVLNLNRENRNQLNFSGLYDEKKLNSLVDFAKFAMGDNSMGSSVNLNGAGQEITQQQYGVLAQLKNSLADQNVNMDTLNSLIQGGGPLGSVFDLTKKNIARMNPRHSGNIANQLGISRSELSQLGDEVSRILAFSRGDIPESFNGVDYTREGENATIDLQSAARNSIQQCQMSAGKINMTDSYMAGNNWQRTMLGKQMYGKSDLVYDTIFGRGWRQLSKEARNQKIYEHRKDQFARLQRANIFDYNYTISDFGAALNDHMPEDLRKLLDDERTTDEMVAVNIKEIILHEFGHVLGMAHNFQENIMPATGTVPAKYINGYYDEATGQHVSGLEEMRKKYEDPKNHSTPYNLNQSTVMGYPHSYIMVAKRMEDVAIGKQDELVLHYLYNNQFAAWNGKDEDFTYIPLAANDGRIPAVGEDLADYSDEKHDYSGYRVTYFPSCTDITEIFGLDPFCNKWDRGYDAKTIVEGYIKDYDNNYIKRLSNIVDTGGDAYFASYMLWVRSIDTFTRLRKFYEYMRDNYRSAIKEIANDNPKNLEDFSKCLDPNQNNETIKKVFAKYSPETLRRFKNKTLRPTLQELCEVNRTVVNSVFSYLLDSGPDFTTYDNTEKAAPVGEVGNEEFQSWNRLFGTHSSLGTLPMKWAALLNMTTSVPYWTYGPEIVPIETYAREGENTKYTYASLYPREFTKGLSDAIIANMKFYSQDAENPTMGYLALFSGLFLGETFWGFNGTNDYQEFDRDYLDTLWNQYKFNFNPWDPYVPILLTAQDSNEKDAEPDRVKQFTATVAEWGNSIPLGNAYMLPEGRVFLRSSPKLFVYPISKVLFFTDKLAVVWGIRVQYNKDNYTNVTENGLNERLFKRYAGVIKSCVDDAKLAAYFSKDNKKFKGFKVIPGIAGNENRYKEFTNSVYDAFQDYYADPDYVNNVADKKGICTKALQDIGLIVNLDLALIGYWMPELATYLRK